MITISLPALASPDPKKVTPAQRNNYLTLYPPLIGVCFTLVLRVKFGLYYLSP